MNLMTSEEIKKEHIRLISEYKKYFHLSVSYAKHKSENGVFPNNSEYNEYEYDMCRSHEELVDFEKKIENKSVIIKIDSPVNQSNISSEIKNLYKRFLNPKEK